MAFSIAGFMVDFVFAAVAAVCFAKLVGLVIQSFRELAQDIGGDACRTLADRLRGILEFSRDFRGGRGRAITIPATPRPRRLVTCAADKSARLVPVIYRHDSAGSRPLPQLPACMAPATARTGSRPPESLRRKPVAVRA